MKLIRTLMALTIVAVGAAPFPLRASESARASALAEECKTSTYACEEYLRGILDAGLIYGEIVHEPGFCPRTRPTADQLLAAFSKWVAANPDQMSLSSGTGAMLALKHAFPCDAEAPPSQR